MQSSSQPERRDVEEVERAGLMGRFRWWPDEDRLEWSDDLYELTGLPKRTELHLESIIRVIPETDPEWLRRAAAGRGPGDAPLVFWQKMVRPDGTERTAEIRAWTAEDGAITGTAQDVTTRVQVSNERDRLARQRELVLNATADGVCGLDREGLITFCNGAAATILGREDEVLLGARLHDLVHRTRDREVHTLQDCPFVRNVADGVARRDRRDYFHRPDATAFEAEYTMLPVSAPELHGCVVSLRDVTSRVSTERRLRRTLREVEALSAQRAKLIGELTLAQEEERARIAADLHDDTVQALHAIALRLERQEVTAPDDGELVAGLRELRGMVRDVTGKLRRVLFDLHPPDLTGELPDAIRRYGDALGGEGGFEIALTTTNTEGLTSDERTLLYRIIQEALANVAAHAAASRVYVFVTAGDNGATLRVEDDGVGFEPRAAHPGRPGHLGLTLMRQRVEGAGGQLRLRSAPGRGTSVEAWMPMMKTTTRETTDDGG